MSPLAVFEDYAEQVRLLFPNGVGRSQMAAQFNVKKSTAAYHLEKCVSRGLLVKAYTWVNRSGRGWVYFHKDNDHPVELWESLNPLDMSAGQHLIEVVRHD